MGLFDKIQDALTTDEAERAQHAQQQADKAREQADAAQQRADEAASKVDRASTDVPADSVVTPAPTPTATPTPAPAPAPTPTGTVEQPKAWEKTDAQKDAEKPATHPKHDTDTHAAAKKHDAATHEVAKKHDAATHEVAKERKEAHADRSERAATKTYTVKSGDTLWDIAKDHGTTVDAIVKANDIKNPDLIFPGQTFTIPS